MRKAVNHLKKSDPVLRSIIERVGPCRMEFGEPTFHSVAESIIYQQLNGKAAVTIFKRFTDAAGLPVTPEGILKLSDEQLRAVGLSKQKSSYVRDLAEKTKAGLLDFSRLHEQSNEDVIEHLTQVKGVGVWTAHMFLMFTLRREDVLPTGDYGIQAAMKKHYRKRKLPKPKDMEKIAKGLGALPIDCLLVFVAEPGYQDSVTAACCDTADIFKDALLTTLPQYGDRIASLRMARQEVPHGCEPASFQSRVATQHREEGRADRCPCLGQDYIFDLQSVAEHGAWTHSRSQADRPGHGGGPLHR